MNAPALRHVTVDAPAAQRGAGCARTSAASATTAASHGRSGHAARFSEMAPTRRHRPRRHQDPDGDRRPRRQGEWRGPRTRPHTRAGPRRGRADGGRSERGRRRRGGEAAELDGVGVGAPGDADAEGVVSAASNIPGWEGSFPLAKTLADRPRTPVRVGGDVQVATEAEFRLGAGEPYDSLLGVFWGTGVGGGMILDGKPWIGRGNAGEIGHIVDQARRPPLPLRAQGLHGGLRRARRDGGQGPRRDGEGPQDEALRAPEGARQGSPHQRHLGAGARPGRRARRAPDRSGDRRRSAPASRRPST